MVIDLACFAASLNETKHIIFSTYSGLTFQSSFSSTNLIICLIGKTSHMFEHSTVSVWSTVTNKSQMYVYFFKCIINLKTLSIGNHVFFCRENGKNFFHVALGINLKFNSTSFLIIELIKMLIWWNMNPENNYLNTHILTNSHICNALLFQWHVFWPA